jgi:hypothetical protein
MIFLMIKKVKFFNFKDLNQNESNTNAPTNINSNLVIDKLKREINHLVLQLMYERHLRDKYEEDSNKLHFIRTERDQLRTEKVYLEKNLKELVERYKNEVEQSLSVERNLEQASYKKELEEKNSLIE